METFGERLRRIREELNISVNELGRRTGKDPGGISRIERGERWGGKQPPGDDIQLFADALGVPFEELRGSVVRLVPPPPPLSDAELMLKFGAEVVPEEEAQSALDDFLEEFTASARTGRGNLIPQNYDEVRARPKPAARGKRKPKPEPTTFKLRVSGDCLKETVADGEIVLFDTTLAREPVALVFAVKDEHEGHIKRLVARGESWWLESDDGWSAPLDEHWRLVARAFTAQRRLL